MVAMTNLELVLVCFLGHSPPALQHKDQFHDTLPDMLLIATRRFYFVSDPTLLEILSLGSDPPSVVPHFQSGLFDSLTNVTFDKVDKTRMLEMFSQQGEKVSAAMLTGDGGLGTLHSWLFNCPCALCVLSCSKHTSALMS